MSIYPTFIFKSQLVLSILKYSPKELLQNFKVLKNIQVILPAGRSSVRIALLFLFKIRKIE